MSHVSSTIITVFNQDSFTYRLLLAPLHYNENSDRKHLERKAVVYRKFRGGKGELKIVKETSTYDQY